MKFFTPELLKQFNSPDEDIVMLAEDKWERGLKTYEEYLASAAPLLPKMFDMMLQSYQLHDARVLGMGKVNDWWTNPAFVIILAPENSHSQLLLFYSLEGDPVIKSSPTPPPSKTALEWLYDEVELPDISPTVRHSILFSDDLEIELNFTDFRLQVVNLPFELSRWYL